MKKLSILFLSVVALATTTFTSCSKDDNKTTTPADTVLDLTIKDADNSNAALGGVVVDLYSDSSFSTKVQSITTGSDGHAKFTGLKNQIYYFNAGTGTSAGCKYNLSVTNTTTAIPTGKTTSLDVPVMSVEAYQVTNSSSNSCKIAVQTSGGYQTITTLPAGKSTTFPIPVGSYVFQYTQVDSSNNPIGTPTTDNVTATACGTASYTIQ